MEEKSTQKEHQKKSAGRRGSKRTREHRHRHRGDTTSGKTTAIRVMLKEKGRAVSLRGRHAIASQKSFISKRELKKRKSLSKGNGRKKDLSKKFAPKDVGKTKQGKDLDKKKVRVVGERRSKTLKKGCRQGK